MCSNQTVIRVMTKRAHWSSSKKCKILYSSSRMELVLKYYIARYILVGDVDNVVTVRSIVKREKSSEQYHTCYLPLTTTIVHFNYKPLASLPTKIMADPNSQQTPSSSGMAALASIGGIISSA